jgi:hypothetical protein
MADGVHASMQKVDAAAGEPAVVCARAEAAREQLHPRDDALLVGRERCDLPI